MANSDDEAAEEEQAESALPGLDLFTHNLELAATVLLAVAAIMTAWAGFESAKWGGVQATLFSEAGANRTESTRFSTLAGQLAQVDISTWRRGRLVGPSAIRRNAALWLC